MDDDKKWHSGPPPSVGWWPASIIQDKTATRWWNGSHWSEPAWPEASEDWAAQMAGEKAVEPQHNIEWQHRPASWPARSKS